MGVDNKGKEKKVELNTRDLILLFIFFLVVLMIVFVIGLMVGKNFSYGPQITENVPQKSISNENELNSKNSEVAPTIQETQLPPVKSEPQAGLPPVVKKTTQKIFKRTKPETIAKKSPSLPIPISKTAEKVKHASKAVKAYFVVQTLATTNLVEARAMVSRLKNLGYEAFIKSPDKAKGDIFYRVRVGSFSRKKNALEMVKRLRKDGFKDAFFKKISH